MCTCECLCVLACMLAWWGNRGVKRQISLLWSPVPILNLIFRTTEHTQPLLVWMDYKFSTPLKMRQYASQVIIQNQGMLLQMLASGLKWNNDRASIKKRTSWDPRPCFICWAVLTLILNDICYRHSLNIGFVCKSAILDLKNPFTLLFYSPASGL